MQSLLAIYGDGVAKSVRVVCFFGILGALAAVLYAVTEQNFSCACKCLGVLMFFAILLVLFPSPEFFRALAGRP